MKRVVGALMGAVLLLCGVVPARAGEADAPLFTFVQVSDTHVVAEKSAEAVRQGIREIARLDPAFVVITGDIINGEAPEASTRFAKELFATLRCPVHAVYGNHDHREWHQKVWGETNYAFDQAPYHCIVLDNIDVSVPEAQETYGGRFSERTIAWLEAHLRTVPRDTPLLLFCHASVFQEHPYAKALPGDAYNYEPVLKLLREHKVVAWFSGHAHRNSIVRKDGIDYITTGGLSDLRQNADGPVGYRVVRVYRDRVESTFQAVKLPE
jgi:3',5'-cyclic AMP phosphodiesterase CpdA